MPAGAGANLNPPNARKFIFRIVLCLLPFMGLGLVEGGLRLAGFGGYDPVFKRVGKTARGELVNTDPAGGESYFFANRKRPGFNDQYCFYEPKGTNTVRIVIVGESAAKGFPQPRNLAASAFLQSMLRDAWPGREIESINLGTTAVASFPVLQMMTDALAFSPDLVIVHTGHNEFFGTYGVASVGGVGGKPWMLSFTRFVHSLAIVQVVDKLKAGREPEGNVTLMERMVSRAYVAPDDWRRKVAANNLFHNIREMIKRCQSRNVTVLVCTQPANERDLAPIGQDKLDGLPEARQQDFAKSFERGQSLLAQNPVEAAEAFRRALALCPNHARAHFQLGKSLFAQDRFTEAHAEFQQARDLDTMPWRATSAANESIRRAAREFGATVCDMEAAFQTNSPGGCIGWELMDDHVHPTLRGQALMAEALVDSLSRFNGSLAISPDARHRIATWPVYAQRLGENKYDRYGVAHMMRVIFDVPFMRETNPDAFARFNQLANELESAESPAIQEAMREYQTSRPHAGGKRPITGLVARVLMREKQFQEAQALYQIAQHSVPLYTSWYLEYVYFALVCEEKLRGRLSEADRARALDAIEQGKVLMQHGFSETGFAERHIGRLHQLRGEFAEAIPFLQVARKKLSGLDQVAANQALIVSFARTGQFEHAREVAANGAAHAGPFAPMYEAMQNELPDLEKASRASGAPTNYGSTLTR